MLLNYNKAVAYICPECSGVSLDTIQIFNFSGKGKHSLVCADCSNECVTIEKKKDKYKIDIQCPICEYTHSYTLKASTFWNIDFISYKCPESDISIYFHGSRDNVAKALDEQEDFLSVKADEYQDICDGKILIREMLRYLQFLAEDNKVLCTCGSQDIDVRVDDESIALRCRSCGASKTFYSDEKSFISFMTSKRIILGVFD